METVEMTGKTLEEATQKALKVLDASEEEVIIEVIEQGSKGFLGIGQKPAKIQARLKPNPVRTAKEFVRDVTNAMGLSVAADIAQEGANINIDLKGSNMGVLIGKHGQTLDSLQYLTNLVVNKNTDTFVNVSINTENYREKRKETLETLARNMAKKAKLTKKPLKLEPMSPAERRVIHASLQGERNVTTYSEGVEPFRYVVIAPKHDYAPKAAHKEGNGAGAGTEKSFQKPYQNKYKPAPKAYGKTDNYKKFIMVEQTENEEEDL